MYQKYSIQPAVLARDIRTSVPHKGVLSTVSKTCNKLSSYQSTLPLPFTHLACQPGSSPHLDQVPSPHWCLEHIWRALSALREVSQSCWNRRMTRSGSRGGHCFRSMAQKQRALSPSSVGTAGGWYLLARGHQWASPTVPCICSVSVSVRAQLCRTSNARYGWECLQPLLQCPECGSSSIGSKESTEVFPSKSKKKKNVFGSGCGWSFFYPSCL